MAAASAGFRQGRCEKAGYCPARRSNPVSSAKCSLLLLNIVLQSVLIRFFGGEDTIETFFDLRSGFSAAGMCGG